MPTQEDLARIKAILSTVGGPDVRWGARNVLEVFVAERRLEAERIATRRLEVATWVLALATFVLAVATVVLVVVTAKA